MDGTEAQQQGQELQEQPGEPDLVVQDLSSARIGPTNLPITTHKVPVC